MLLLAPDKFKGTLAAHQVAAALSRGWRDAWPDDDVVAIQMADGGEGTLAALAENLDLRPVVRCVAGPRGIPVEATFGRSADGATSVVELAAASGLGLLAPLQRDPTRTTTFGTGELVRAALELGAQRVIVALGGSATCDGGAGLAQALGVRFRDADDKEIAAPITGAELSRVASWEPSPLLRRAGRGDSVPVMLEGAVDVDSPLLGPLGAARLFAPQKGASPEQVELLERGLAALAAARCESAGVAQPGPNGSPSSAQSEALSQIGSLAVRSVDAVHVPGAGAAGGCGFGLRVFCGASLRPGADLVLDAAGFDERLKRATLVLTGEGRLDESSLRGKSAVAVARRARPRGLPVIAVVGEIAPGLAERMMGPAGLFDDIVVLSERFGPDRALGDAEACLRQVAAELAGRWRRRR